MNKPENLTFIVRLKFEVKVSLLDAIKMRFMGIQNSRCIVDQIIKHIEKSGDIAGKN